MVWYGSSMSLPINLLQMFCKGKEPYDFAVLPELLCLAAVNEETLPGKPIGKKGGEFLQTKKIGRGDGLIIDPRIKAPEQHFVGAEWEKRGKLGDTKWQELQQRGAPGKRLADSPQQFELLRTGQDKKRILPSFVDNDLNVRQQAWNPLDFINDNPFRILVEEGHRVFLGKLPGNRVFKIGIGLIDKGQP